MNEDYKQSDVAIEVARIKRLRNLGAVRHCGDVEIPADFPVPPLTITAQEAAKRIAKFREEQRDRFRVKLPPLRSKKHVHIFNVGPFAHTAYLGSLGKFEIQPCPEGSRYSELVIPAYVCDFDPGGRGWIRVNGLYVAREILGTPLVPASLRIARLGIFIAKEVGPSVIPKESELIAAKDRLALTCLRLVQDGCEAYALTKTRLDIGSQHLKAAKALGLQDYLPWFAESGGALRPS
jgi:hypothetical protein